MASMNRHATQFLFFFVPLLAINLATPTFAQSAEEQAVLAPIHAMFDGMSKRDAGSIKTPTLPGGAMVLMRDGKPTQMTFEAFAERVSKPGTTQIEERIHDPLVRIDNDLAVVWAPFDFLVDGKVDHCGTDLFSLVRIDGKWTIAERCRHQCEDLHREMKFRASDRKRTPAPDEKGGGPGLDFGGWPISRF